MGNPLMSPRIYAQVTGIALAAIALLGIVLSTMGQGGHAGIFCQEAVFCEGEAAESSFLGFDWTHNVVHVLLAAVALFVGFSSKRHRAATYAKVFGTVYVALAIVGFIPPVANLLDTLLALHLELGENLVHLLIGGWGVVTGFFGATQPHTKDAATATTRARRA